MASNPRLAAGAYRVDWRRGGRNGTPQVVSFPVAKLGDEGALKLAQAAKSLIDSRRNLITAKEVYTAILGEDPDADTLACPTMAEWTRDWLKGKRDVSMETLAEYRWLLMSRVVPIIGELRVSFIDSGVVKRVIDTAADDDLAPATLRKLHVVLAQVLGAAVPQWLKSNPCAKPPGKKRRSELPKVMRHEAVYLTRAEADLIIASCPDQIRDLVIVALGTGLRLGELLALRVGDVDLGEEESVIHVQRSRKKSGKVGDPKSEAGTRPVALTDSCTKVIRPRVANRPPKALVFLSPARKMWDPKNLRNRYWTRALIAAARCVEHPPAPEGRPLEPGEENLGQWCRDHGGVRTDGKPCGAKIAPGMNRCRQHLGVPRDAVSDCECPTRLHVTPRWHDTRHSHVDWLLDAEWDIYEVQLRIGHESVKTTIDMYGNRRRKPAAGRLAKLEEVLPGPRTSAEDEGQEAEAS